MVTETSLMAWTDLKEETKETMQLKVYEVIKKYPKICDKEIAEVLGIEINRVTPRRGEIAAKGLIIKGEKKKYNGRLVNTWIDKKLLENVK